MLAALQYGGKSAPAWLDCYVIADHFHLDPRIVRTTWPLAEYARVRAYLRNLPRD